MSIYNYFDTIWSKFIVICRAKLIEKSRQCALTKSAAEISLKDAMSVWFDKYDICGKWLSDLEKESPQAVKNIKDVIQGFCLKEISLKKALSDAEVYGVTAGSAVAGAGIGKYILDLGKIGTVMSAVVPLVILYPIFKNYQKMDVKKSEKDTIQAYLDQLSFVKEEIEEILKQYNCGYNRGEDE